MTISLILLKIQNSLVCLSKNLAGDIKIPIIGSPVHVEKPVKTKNENFQSGINQFHVINLFIKEIQRYNSQNTKTSNIIFLRFKFCLTSKI